LKVMSWFLFIFRFRYIRSPNVPIEAQLFVLLGALNRRGFIQTHKIESAIDTNEYTPIHSLDQKAKEINGNVVNRV
jgi:hypothetical protein